MDQDINGVRGIVYIEGSPIRYVLVKSKRGVISFPGGGVEKSDRSLQAAMIRELKEETGLEPKDYFLEKTDIIDKFIYDKDKDKRADERARQIVFLVKTNKKSFTPEEEAEIKGPYSEKEVLENLTFATSKNIYKKALKYINK